MPTKSWSPSVSEHEEEAARLVAEKRKAKQRRVIMGKKVIKKQRRWVTLKRVGTEKRYSLKLAKKGRAKLVVTPTAAGRPSATSPGTCCCVTTARWS